MNFLKDYKPWMVLTIILALAAGILSVWLLSSYAGTVAVLENGADLGRGVIVQPQSLSQAQCSRGNLYRDVIVDPGQVVGKVARGFIPAGTILRQSMFETPEQTEIASRLAILGKDYEAVAISLDMHTTVAGIVNANDHVDIYAYPKDSPSQIKILSGVLVLQAGTTRAADGSQQASQGIVVALSQKGMDTLLPYLAGSKAAPLLFTLKPVEP